MHTENNHIFPKLQRGCNFREHCRISIFYRAPKKHCRLFASDRRTRFGPLPEVATSDVTGVDVCGRHRLRPRAPFAGATVAVRSRLSTSRCPGRDGGQFIESVAAVKSEVPNQAAGGRRPSSTYDRRYSGHVLTREGLAEGGGPSRASISDEPPVTLP
jgi:hypothetical protein